MPGLEPTKIVGATTGALAVFLAIRIVSNGLLGVSHHGEPEPLAYSVEITQSGGAAEEEETPLAARLAAADPDVGARVFRRCQSCHNVEKGAGPRTGPPLYGVVGRDIASIDGFSYAGLSNKAGEGAWDFEKLDAFLTNPSAWAPGTGMSLRLSKPEDRAAVMVYLNTQSDAPVALPEADAAAVEAVAAAAEASAAEPEDFGVLFVAPGVEETFYACTVCHSERIVAQQGMTRERWDKTLEWMVDEQGMSEIEEPERGLILDYLATHYGPDRPNFPD